MLHLVASQAATIYQEMNSLRTLTRYTDNILRSIAAGVITVDKNGFIVTWNRRAEEIVAPAPARDRRAALQRVHPACCRSKKPCGTKRCAWWS